MKENKEEFNGMVIGMLLGMSLGTAIGSATGHLPIGMSMGLALGVAIGLVFDQKNKPADETEKSESEENHKEER